MLLSVHFLKHSLFVFSILLIAACGNQSYVTEHIVDFRIFPDTQDPIVLDSLELLTEQYNDEIGFTAINLVYDKDEANSFINFPVGLRSSENKLGLGQWITVTTAEGRDILPSKRVLTRSVIYAMEIDFDFQNFRDKSLRSLHNNDEKAWAHLYHLYCHEIGHGLQMNHEDVKSSVMYPSIPEQSRPNVAYDKYFQNARKFFERVNEENRMAN